MVKKVQHNKSNKNKYLHKLSPILNPYHFLRQPMLRLDVLLFNIGSMFTVFMATSSLSKRKIRTINISYSKTEKNQQF